MGLKPIISTISVATAGTAVVASASNMAISVYFEALSTNAGAITIGDSTVTATSGFITRLTAGAGFGISTDAQGRLGGELQLSSIFVNAATAGDKVQMTYLPRIGQY